MLKENITDSYEMELYEKPEKISDEQIINKSKAFYLKMKKESRNINIEPFGQVLPYFANGVMQKLANENECIKWKLYE